MIRTRYGSEVKIVWGDLDRGTVKIQYRDGFQFQTPLYNLRADGGLPEIATAIDEAMTGIPPIDGGV